jgi:uncharacterized protein (TIGR04255 family)
LEDNTRLSKAPITEALIDIRVKLAPDFDIGRFDEISAAVRHEYPARQEQRVSHLQFQMGPEENRVDQQTKINGYRYLSSDKKQIFQVRIDGFTFNRLAPYADFERLRSEAQALWRHYKKAVTPVSITRVALRYINRLNIPFPIGDFADYLTAPPLVPEGLPQGVSGFLTRVVIHESYIGANAVITQALEPAVGGDAVPIILDIDTFIDRPEGLEEGQVWEVLEKLRHFKNRIFFRSITLKLKEMYA